MIIIKSIQQRGGELVLINLTGKMNFCNNMPSVITSKPGNNCIPLRIGGIVIVFQYNIIMGRL